MGPFGRRLAVLGPLLVAACGPAAPPPPTVVNLRLVATPDVNMAGGQGQPVVVRIYQLASKSGFEGAEFFRLYQADAATLGPDLIKKDEMLLAPGVTKTLSLAPTDAVHAIGVFAAYQGWQGVTWRATADIPPHATTVLKVDAGATGVMVRPDATPPGKS